MSKVFHSRGENCSFRDTRSILSGNLAKIQVKFIHIPNLNWSLAWKTPSINQQRYPRIQHLEPKIRHMAYNPKKVRQ